MSFFRVIDGGILSLVEDLGRFGLCDKGITNSGVMDEYAYGALNLLLQNPFGTNCVEITLGGLKLEANGSCTIATTGANCKFLINSKEVDTWRTYNIKKGDTLEFGFAKSGLRIYLGVKGGFEIKKELGSNSVTIKENIGRKLEKGDLLKFADTSLESNNFFLKKQFIPTYPKELTLRVLLGYQDDLFEKEELEKFFSSDYMVSSQFNRMGYRLDGQEIKCKANGIISEGISFGAIQIPKDGKPIVLLKERQTIGGYPKIGSVLPVDCFKLSQLKSGDRVNFTPISLQEAEKKMSLFRGAIL